MGVVQDLHDHLRLVQEAVVAQLLADAFEDLGEGSLAQTLHLGDTGRQGLGLTQGLHRRKLKQRRRLWSRDGINEKTSTQK